VKVKKMPNGFYDYDDDSVFKLMGMTEERKCVIYARVSTQKQKKSLDSQVKMLTDYAISNGFKISETYRDIASGLSYDRENFMDMLKSIIERKIKTVFITDRDRLTRVSFNMWKALFGEFNCELKAINESETSDEDSEKEIFSDIISLLHCFAMKMYSARRKKKMALVSEDLENEIDL
jgi:putative resolvase